MTNSSAQWWQWPSGIHSQPHQGNLLHYYWVLSIGPGCSRGTITESSYYIFIGLCFNQYITVLSTFSGLGRFIFIEIVLLILFGFNQACIFHLSAPNLGLVLTLISQNFLINKMVIINCLCHRKIALLNFKLKCIIEYKLLHKSFKM